MKGIDTFTSEIVKQKTRMKIRQQILELCAQGQFYNDPRCSFVTCECGKKIALFSAYRCFYCKIYYCDKCAEKHFEDAK